MNLPRTTDVPWNVERWKFKGYSKAEVNAAETLAALRLIDQPFRTWCLLVHGEIDKCTPGNGSLQIYFRGDAFNMAIRALEECGWREVRNETAAVFGRRDSVNPNSALRVLQAEGALIFTVR